MKAVAYCRVSTNKEDQLNSYAAQEKFFLEYAQNKDYNLVKIYGDEGKSGTKLKTRPELLKLLADAEKHMFDTVLIKDVSRLARNTVDFLTSIRRLKSLGVKVVFVNYDQTSSDSSEFMLTMLSAIAQEESANTSKRIKFGKEINKKNGRVPNFVFGYNKIKGDYFNLQINKEETALVRRIFDMYVNQNIGATKISILLNKEGLKTKRNAKWGQAAIARILSNQIYIGKIINGKEETTDFLTSERTKKSEDEWYVVENPALKIIDEKTFNKAQKILAKNRETFKITNERNSTKYPFSQLIKCKHCGYSFRRVERKFANTYIRWCCSYRNSKGADTCPNHTLVDEKELMKEIKKYLKGMLASKPNVIKRMVDEFKRIYNSKDENQKTEKDLRAELAKIDRLEDKKREMYEADLLPFDDLRKQLAELAERKEWLINEIDLAMRNISKSDLLDNNLKEIFTDIETLLTHTKFTNEQLSRIIDHVEVDKDGNVDIYLKLLIEMGLEQNVLLTNENS